MATETTPIVGYWYKGSEAQPFEVVAIDDHDETVEIQYADGAVEEFDMESWYSLDLSMISAPDNINSLFDNLEHEEDVEQGFFNSHEHWSDYMDDYE